MATPALFLVLLPLSGFSTVSEFTTQDEDAGAPAWSGSLLVGFTNTSGNTKNRTAALTGDAQRETETDRYKVKIFYNKAEQDGERSERNLGADGQYDYLAGERHYYFATVAVEADEQAKLDRRYQAGGGLGYEFYGEEDFTLEGEVGLIYVAEEFDDGTDSNSVSAILGYDLGYAFNARARLTQDFDAYPATDDFDDVFLRLDTRVESNLTDSMLASAQYVFDWDNTPAAGANRADHRFVLSIGWSFGK